MSGEVKYREFATSDGPAFQQLNEEWIKDHWVLEEKDKKTLQHPDKYIIQPGGRIFVTEQAGEVVACCALMYMSEGQYEVAKMTVSKSHRGKGLGKGMLTYTIDQARKMGTKKLVDLDLG
eukprot:TRINITY_DN5063_c0_g1_i1.p1 TRINITY_DN5063_c0_g1~~TRINITY_DN5063_c0_g1_i1.p1  ORF type:complete len:130 (+),score=29.02 TRINITY_DN5063_c0_g1_i1:33-392(+)